MLQQSLIFVLLDSCSKDWRSPKLIEIPNGFYTPKSATASLPLTDILKDMNTQEIQQLLAQLSQTYPINTETEKKIFVTQFDEEIKTNSRLRNMLIEGGKRQEANGVQDFFKS